MRELISKIQNMRKEAGFEVTDKIVVAVDGTEKVNAVVAEDAADICREVMAERMEASIADGYSREWNVNGEQVTITVKKCE